MENYIIAGLVFIIILILIRKNTSSYTTADTPSPISNFYATYQIIGYDLNKTGGWPSTQAASVAPVAGTTTGLILADANQFTWSREKVNYQMYAAATPGVTANGTFYPIANVWGFRKQLQVGGGGSLWYIVSPTTTDQTSLESSTPSTDNNLVLTETLTDVTISSTTYAIPVFVSIKKSPVTAVLQCDSHATKSAQNDDGSGGSCVCNTGYYGTGYDSSSVTGAAASQAGCLVTPVGYYAAAGATNATQCPADPIRGSGYQITAQTGSTVQAACFTSCSTNAIQSGGTTTTAGSCTCNAGYYTVAGQEGVTCTGCSAGTAQPNQTNVTSCPACVAGTYATGTATVNCTSCGLGTYNSAPGNTTGCTNCAAGKTTQNLGGTSCIKCGGGTYTTGAGGSCQSCPAGQTAKSDNTGCENLGTNAALNLFAGTTPVGTPSAPATQMIFSVGSSQPTNSLGGTATLTGNVWTWYPPTARQYTFTLTGGFGGGGSAGNGASPIANMCMGGPGAVLTVTYTVTDTTKPFYIVVGGGGTFIPPAAGSSVAAGGGGASYVFTYSSGTLNDWAVAGGGGGGCWATWNANPTPTTPVTTLTAGPSPTVTGGSQPLGAYNSTNQGQIGAPAYGITPTSTFAGGTGSTPSLYNVTGGNGGVGGGGPSGPAGGGGGAGVTGGGGGSNGAPANGGTSGCSSNFSNKSIVANGTPTPARTTGANGTVTVY